MRRQLILPEIMNAIKAIIAKREAIQTSNNLIFSVSVAFPFVSSLSGRSLLSGIMNLSFTQ
jgi:hypothetical protein